MRIIFLSTKPIGNKQNKARKTGTKIKQQQHCCYNDFNLENIKKVMANVVLSLGGPTSRISEGKRSKTPDIFSKL